MSSGFKRTLFVLQFLLCLSIFCSCSKKENNELTWTRNVAKIVAEDGWVYTCEYFYFKDGRVDRSIPPIKFNVINLRYLNENCIQIMGNEVSEETDRDMKKISSFLGYGNGETSFPTIEEIQSKEKELNLEVIDAQMFFEMLDKVMSGEPLPQGKYLNYPIYALLNEPGFTDGYQFQIGYSSNMGNIDVIMIDVLYRDNTSATGYRQLSDMIADGTASEKQMILFDQLTKIEEGIIAENDFCYGESKLAKDKIAEVKLARLYTMLSDIDRGKYQGYDASAWTN